MYKRKIHTEIIPVEKHDIAFSFIEKVYKKYHLLNSHYYGISRKYHEYPDYTVIGAYNQVHKLIGAIVLIEDSYKGIPSDDVYKDKIDKLREKISIFEISGISTIEGKFETVLRMWLHAAKIAKNNYLVGIVSPKHMAFYSKYGIGTHWDKEVRQHPHIENAPSCLGWGHKYVMIVDIYLFLLMLSVKNFFSSFTSIHF